MFSSIYMSKLSVLYLPSYLWCPVTLLYQVCFWHFCGLGQGFSLFDPISLCFSCYKKSSLQWDKGIYYTTWFLPQTLFLNLQVFLQCHHKYEQNTNRLGIEIRTAHLEALLVCCCSLHYYHKFQLGCYELQQ